MRRFKFLFLACAATLVLSSCFEDLDDNAVASSDIKDFVWKGMNAVYLYKSDVPDLFDDRFETNSQYSDYLNDFASPEDLFESLRFLPIDERFSRIYDNYFDLQNQQQGVSLSNGIEYNLYRLPGSETELIGAITLVLENSIADNLGLERGMIFRGVNGELLSNDDVDDLNDPIYQNTFTLDFADYDTNGTPETEDDTVTLNGISETLTKEQYTENPIHIAQTITLSDDTKVGYLMYNQFNASFDSALNAAFADFQADGVTELVLDLRYNGGGSVQTGAYLGSMITGQFNGSVFSKTFYNENLESLNRDYLFTNSLEGGGSINSLNLTKVYVLTTNRRTASASELVINSLSAYIDVVVIGENTVGKTQASRTVFDSPTLFTTEGVNPGHTYAMQPLVANSVNVNDQLVPSNGLTPNIEVIETPINFGTLGNITEPLLATAILEISGAGRFAMDTAITQSIITTNPISPLEQDMYID